MDDRAHIYSEGDRSTCPPGSPRSSREIPLRSGDVIRDRFEVVEELGHGGMGTVYRVRDRQQEETVCALKIIRGMDRLDASSVERLRQEAALTREMRHDGIVAVYDFDFDPDRELYFLTMEAIRGESLDDVLAQAGGRFAVNRCVNVARRLVDIMAYAHRRVYHLDLKPQNVMLQADGGLKVFDFGLAELAAFQNQASGPRGTPGYRAPELARGGAADHRADIYAIGVILYRMLTGSVPSDTSFKRPKLIDKQIPKWLDRVVMRCLESEPASRYKDMRSLREALAPTFFERRAFLRVALALIAVVVATTITLWIFTNLLVGSERSAIGPSAIRRGQTQNLAENLHANDHSNARGDRVWEANRTIHIEVRSGIDAPASMDALRPWLFARAKLLASERLYGMLGEGERDFRPFVDLWIDASFADGFGGVNRIDEVNGFSILNGALDLNQFDAFLDALRKSTLDKTMVATPLVIDVQLLDSKGKLIRAGDHLNSGDHFSITFLSNLTCFVYILNQSSGDEIKVLYPQEELTSSPKVEGKQSVRLPGESHDFILDEEPGIERIVLVASLAPLEDIDYLLNRIALLRGRPSEKNLLEARLNTRGISVTTRLETSVENAGGEVERVEGGGAVLRIIDFEHKPRVRLDDGRATTDRF